MSYSVKIVKNDTGEVVCDYDNACAIMAAINHGEKVHQICGISCNALNLYATVDCLQNLLQMTCKAHPEIDVIAKLEGTLYELQKKMGDEE